MSFPINPAGANTKLGRELLYQQPLFRNLEAKQLFRRPRSAEFRKGGVTEGEVCVAGLGAVHTKGVQLENHNHQIEP